MVEIAKHITITNGAPSPPRGSNGRTGNRRLSADFASSQAKAARSPNPVITNAEERIGDTLIPPEAMAVTPRPIKIKRRAGKCISEWIWHFGKWYDWAGVVTTEIGS